MTPTEYKDRLQNALEMAGKSDKDLQKHLGVTIQAITKVLGGKTAALSAPNNSKAADFLKVDSDWLALGVGKPKVQKGWPFDLFDRADYLLVDEHYRQRIESELAGEIIRIKKTIRDGLKATPFQLYLVQSKLFPEGGT